MAEDKIAINHENVETYANNIKNVFEDWKKSSLGNKVDLTTLTANKSLSNSYNNAKNLMDQHRTTLSTDCENIKKISNVFKNVDEDFGNKMSQLGR